MNIYVTSTDNGSGKTIISAGIAAVMQSLDYKSAVYKPIQIGAIDKGNFLLSPDLAFVKMLDPYITTHSTYMFKNTNLPLSQNSEINFQEIINDFEILSEKSETLIIEAPAGLMTPICENFFAYKIPFLLKTPIVFVTTPSLNSINHLFNEINTAKAIGLDILGIIINKFPRDSTEPEIVEFAQTIEKYSDVKTLGLIKKFKNKNLKKNLLINEVINGIELENLFRIKIPKLNTF